LAFRASYFHGRINYEIDFVRDLHKSAI